MSGTVQFSDLAGNIGNTGIEITWIDTDKPNGIPTYTPANGIRTNESVTITLRTNEPILNVDGRLNI
jgi:hypothetical protein